jgi:hypothetical protein
MKLALGNKIFFYSILVHFWFPALMANHQRTQGLHIFILSGYFFPEKNGSAFSAKQRTAVLSITVK